MKKFAKYLPTLEIAAILLVIAAGFVFGVTPVYAADMQQDSSGHDSTMQKEDTSVFIKELEKAAQDLINQVKAGRTMDAQKTVAQLTSSAEKILPHITDADLKEKLRGAANEIKDSVNSGQADIFELEDKTQVLNEIMNQVADLLQKMK